MAEFDTAKYIDQEITPKEYQEDTHRNKILCPECEIAPLHIVNRQKGFPFFKSNRKEEHKPDCQHYRDFIKSRELKRLTKSIDVDDKKRLNFLVKMNILSTIRLLTGDLSTHDLTFAIEKSRSEKKPLRTKSANIKFEHIPRVHIKNIYKKKHKFLNEYVIIYGISQIEIKKQTRVNRETKEEFEVKKIVFRVNNKYRFSINLNSVKSRYFNVKIEKETECDFAVFGKLALASDYLCVEVLRSDHIQYYVK